MLKRSDLPLEIEKVLTFIESKNATYYIVGGFSRDYLLNKTFSRDVDIEVKALPLDWKEELESLFKVEIKVLPYDILSFELGNYQFELQAPRLEVYKNNSSKTHHGFDVIIDSNLNPKDSFKRRDFTINAIGLSFYKESDTAILVDPFDGLKDLSQKILETKNPDFTFDPVRFLRTVRFLSNFGFELGMNLQNKMPDFDLQELSIHYLKKEFLACHEKNKFCKNLKRLTDDNKLFLKHLETEITFCHLIAIEGRKFSKVEELFAKLCEETISIDLEKCILNQDLFASLKKYGKNILLWIKVKSLMDNHLSTDLTENQLHALISWERFLATDFFNVAKLHFSLDQKKLERFVKLCQYKLTEKEKAELDSLQASDRNTFSWKIRLNQ